MATIDLTGDDDALGETLSPHDPRRRALKGGKPKKGAELRAAIIALHKADPTQSGAAIAEKVGCSRQHVSDVLSNKPPKGRIPAALLKKMVAALKAGASGAELLDQLPEIANIFRSQKKSKTGKGQFKSERERVLASLRVLIAQGKDATEGPAFELYQARQAGKLKG